MTSANLDLMVDIDDVIFPTMASIHDLAEAAGLHDGTAKMAWSGWHSYTLPNGDPCPEQVYWDLWSDFQLSDGYVKTPPIPGAAEALRFLMYEGHRIHLVTARGFMAHAEEIREATPLWIEEFAIPHASLTFAQDKVAAQAELGVHFDYSVDDSPKNTAALTAAGVEAYLLTHPHNEDVEADRRVSTLWEWAHIIDQHQEAS